MNQLFRHALGGKVLLNVQARSAEAAAEASGLLGAAVLVGVMARDFPRLEDGVNYVQTLHAQGVQVSVGLGDGSAEQWERALQLALRTKPHHLNQIFSAASLSQSLLRSLGAPTLVNGMVKPAGQPGLVHIGTGPLSQLNGSATIPVQAALAILKETGVQSVKFFPIEGTGRLEELRQIARAVAEMDMMLEPTGGITPENVAAIVGVCLEEGVQYIMPHLYGSLKNRHTGDLDMQKLETAYKNVQSLF